MWNDFHWSIKFLMMLGIGTAMSLSMLFGSKPSILKLLGGLPFLSPNWLSIWRAPIVGAGVSTYILSDTQSSRLTGFLLIVFGLTLDRIDGKMAKSLICRLKKVPYPLGGKSKGHNLSKGRLCAWYQERAQENLVVIEDWVTQLLPSHTKFPMFKLIRDKAQPAQKQLKLELTHMGEWLDPLIDKINYHPLLVWAAFKDYLSATLVVLMLFFDFISTIIREPFLSLRWLKILQPYIKEAKASAFGKTKVVWQICTVLSIIPVTSNWLTKEEAEYSFYISSSFLGLGVISGILSVISRLSFKSYLMKVPGFKNFYKDMEKLYEHDVTEKH